jgi:multiple sugar transport system substrate-binding protein
VPVSLTPGKNTITVAARDKAGNVRQMAIVVTRTAVPSHVVVLTVGKTVMTVDGASRPVDAGRDTAPVIVRGRTLVPISSVMSAVGGTAVWNAAARTVTLTLGKNTAVLTIGKPTALVNGKAVRIDSQDSQVVPVIENGRTMLPLRFVGESLGASVQWDAAARRVTLTFASA